MINLKKHLEEVEIEFLKQALNKYPDNYAAAADSVGMLRTTFLFRLKKLGLYQKRSTPRRDYSKKKTDSNDDLE